jgi:hypothetical protein
VLTAVATARFDAVSPLVATPAATAAASTSSWAYAFVVAALLLFAAAVIVGFLLRPHPNEPHPEELTVTNEPTDQQRGPRFSSTPQRSDRDQPVQALPPWFG